MTTEQIEKALQKMVEIVGGKSYLFLGEKVHLCAGGGLTYVFSTKWNDTHNANGIQVLFDAIAIEDERMVYYVVKIALEIAVYDGANTTFFRSRKPGLSLTERVLDVMYQWAVKDED